MPRNILIKIVKTKSTEEILEASKQKTHCFRATPIRMTKDFSSETSETRRKYPSKTMGGVKIFSDKRKRK